MAANFGCIRNAAGYNDWHQILIIGAHGAWEMPALLTADYRVKWYAGGGSFLPLPLWHAFCWWRLWNNSHYSCENSLEEVQGATASSHIPPLLLQDPWLCIKLLLVERHALCQWNLATHQDEPAVLAAQGQGHDQTDLQYQARGCGPGKVNRATGKAWAWGPWPHFEREKASLVWACGAF